MFQDVRLNANVTIGDKSLKIDLGMTDMFITQSVFRVYGFKEPGTK